MPKGVLRDSFPRGTFRGSLEQHETPHETIFDSDSVCTPTEIGCISLEGFRVVQRETKGHRRLDVSHYRKGRIGLRIFPRIERDFRCEWIAAACGSHPENLCGWLGR